MVHQLTKQLIGNATALYVYVSISLAQAGQLVQVIDESLLGNRDKPVTADWLEVLGKSPMP
jgi:hypothetical protein